ncbi:tRNA (mnm(5)s(2)U34)-methyltransferase / FAD-dependent cmnm(5)s(2)U34 oxidoreductase [Georgfuchsia toluolica]|uniref:tRNA 5-methylaminomethyl-2-thiouridine biosynthesis bifunctional protein MnmC n=1 Tax=Georgfuchsia toluolica TaxID=424218 RepID=A0A916J3D7_9PROT|nr:bifunctional tRNA (5-methylaminomethyl-2-thiouridine)(34)-methyltransferase MnmD/FAD-dependent 5-carboxymethylaminomethyl-2-thiouridine(34) oxidoreductase MnmC [Georgfuchsia toluolica]CAG4883217.1 tRNA (mnm(5)s(2)U34)-methyltransferase / FAD-dependent cmnm(5)s(2)U34 oxidoreductase [Georgfuchsia toluolica]
MPFALDPATLSYTANDVPYSAIFDDIYHSADGGLEQAQHVFLAGNDLPRAWRDRELFVILETGFGLGLNFLATWQRWREDHINKTARCQRLHFVSVEKHPFARADLAQLHARWPQLAALADELQAQWPLLTPGVHRLLLDNGRVTLTLLFGDATTQMRKLAVAADALYLDGFAPAKNPVLWDPQLLKAVTRLCKPGATLATWSVAAPVREALAAQRWTLEKRPGFGSKRDMLCGRLFGKSDGNVPPSAPPRHAIVIGGGIAGCAITERLAARQWHVDLFERRSAISNIIGGFLGLTGLLHPLLAKDDNLAARLTRAGYLYALRLFRQLDAKNLGLRWSQCGILHLARDAEEERAQRDITDALGFPGEYAEFIDRETAARQAGHVVAAGGWYYPGGAIVNPITLFKALLARHSAAISTHFHTDVARLEYDGGNWHAIGVHGQTLGSAPVAIVANSIDAVRLVPQCKLPLSKMRGQISMLPRGSLPFLHHALCGNGYLTPDTLGRHCLGATYDKDDDPEPREDSHCSNLQRLAELLPGGDLPQFEPAQLAGLVGFRAIAIDRMPIVGALPDMTQTLKPGAQLRDVLRLPGLHSLLAMGSRGLAWAPLAAELLAAQLNNEPLPLERDLLDAIDPGRFMIRNQRRGIAWRA